MNDSIFDYEILPKNYTIFLKDRRSRGGGVLVAVDSSLSCYEVASPPDLAVISVKIGHILLCTVYISPNIDTGSLMNLLSYLADLSSSSEHLLIVGDFNAPDIKWSSLTGTQSHSNLICDFVFHANFTQVVLEPTHTKGHILDIVLANCDLIQNLQVDTAHPVLSSDHYAITFDIDYYHKPVLKCKNQYVYDYRNADLKGLFDFISNCDFDICYQSNDIEYVWSTIYSYLHTAMDLFIPK